MWKSVPAGTILIDFNLLFAGQLEENSPGQLFRWPEEVQEKAEFFELDERTGKDRTYPSADGKVIFHQIQKTLPLGCHLSDPKDLIA